MDLHAVLPAEQADADPRRLAEFARTAEELGYGGVWLPDHLMPPEPFGGRYGGPFDALVTLGHLAAVTQRIELGTSVVILPLRNPFVVAKQAATLAALSGDRFVLGVGAGWEKHEFDATGADFTTRGARTTSALRLIRHLHATGGAPFEDPYYGHPGGHFAPARPVPLLVGGTSDAALRRAGAVGDRWQAFGLTPEAFAARVARLSELADRPIGVEARIAMGEGSAAVAASDTAAELDSWAAAGAERLAVWFSGDIDSAGERMRALAALPAAAHFLSGDPALPGDSARTFRSTGASQSHG
ncbi:TIGR03619 family F420-dependent LLM class oxidoreductase [Streptomyces sp. AcE210]|uniref:TIGR03619 family F420-dependent LLM class oxidoreductase n=1 Tax=Streptomyces sp. AcE210 TaxID=2292703 RepID=UPI000E30A704|nr:TIGR03619 family F420-dependent LLM class oxidoreductase [Streptomyces sp. AcE210]RFC69804.1 TIGR03619 family F420-dependent LLM class oxidoreductase [Streptomyces sp. AcE210]